ncbi:MAG: CRISPR-associated endonuclease Cas3'' [Rubrivivax sp.]
MTHAQNPQPGSAGAAGTPIARPGRVFHAHSLTDRPEAHWQPLVDHLQAVAALAARFAEWFGGQAFAHAAGLLHDLGKYTEEFQQRIRGQGDRVDHATWGARIAVERFGPLGYLIAYAIAGHHAGLADGEGEASRTNLRQRLDAELPTLLDAWRHELDLPQTLQAPAGMKPKSAAQANFMLSLLVRMLFSCLVDADFLDTEAFYAEAEGRGPARASSTLTMAALRDALDSHLQAMASRVDNTPVNAERTNVLQHVRTQAALAPGLFSLTVPTGGGKTLTSLAFGLDHAVAHGLRRLIYVIPFTSIVEQNAAVFRRALGPLGGEAVLEHHSAFADDPRQAREAREKIRLAMENWDAPVVVTTAVQFFESLFADRPSQCRKLHNVAGSVIVLDEAQTLPLKLLMPTLLALDELARNYRCSIVFCTATQPALADERFRNVIGSMRELAPDPVRLFQVFRRVTVRHAGPMSDADVVARMAQRDQALCIVNNRLHARALYQGLSDQPGAWHLSTLMCAQHRRQVLQQAREALRRGQPCRLVSTSLIEAGVDVSFPLVLRADAGLDSVAQAAGRCNREGLWSADASEVLVFSPDTEQWKPPRELAQFAAVAAQVLRRHAGDPLAPAAIRDYFEELYWTRGDRQLDVDDLLGRLRAASLTSLPMDTLARLYRLIDTQQETVIVAFDNAAKAAIERLRFADGVRGLARTLQPYTVQIPRRTFETLVEAGAVAAVNPGSWGHQFMLLTNRRLYRADVGLDWEHPEFLDAIGLVL